MNLLHDRTLFDALPGAGPIFAPRLLVAFGENRERFPTASSLQKSAGIAPVMERSGNKAWVHWRYSCSKFVRQTFVEWAAQTIPRSFWAKAFYESCRTRGRTPPSRPARPGIQMDPHPAPLLARPRPV